MRAAAIDRFGGIDVLGVRTLPVPEVGFDDVLIRVEAAGVGSWDAVEREGAYDGAFGVESTFPYVLGWDGAGTVAAIGEGVSRFAVGDRVYAASMPLPRGGFYAEYAVVEQDYVARIPDGLPMEQAAAMPWDALTALSGLDALELRSGDAVMIFGASGVSATSPSNSRNAGGPACSPRPPATTVSRWPPDWAPRPWWMGAGRTWSRPPGHSLLRASTRLWSPSVVRPPTGR